MKLFYFILIFLYTCCVNSQPNVLKTVISKESDGEEYVGEYKKNLVFYNWPNRTFTVYNYETKTIEKKIALSPETFPPARSKFMMKNETAYFFEFDRGGILGFGSSKLGERYLPSCSFDVPGVNEVRLYSVNLETEKINKAVYKADENAEYYCRFPFFNADSSTIELYYIKKVEKNNYSINILSFGCDLIKKDEAHIPVGDFDQYDQVMEIAADKENNLQVFFRNELSGKESKAANKLFIYSIFSYDRNTKTFTTTEILNGLNKHTAEIGWTWDPARKNCFFATYISEDYRKKQIGVRFEKFSTDSKKVEKKNFMFTQEFLNRFKESPDERPFISHYVINRIHLTPDGNLYVLGEYYHEPSLWRYTHGAYRDPDAIYNDPGNNQQRIESGPLMVFHITNDLNIKWSKQLDKYNKIGNFGSNTPVIIRGYKSIIDSETLKIFYPDETRNIKLVEGHPFVADDPKSERNNSEECVFQVTVKPNGDAEKIVILKKEKNLNPNEMIMYPVFFPFGKKYFMSCLTIIPIK